MCLYQTPVWINYNVEIFRLGQVGVVALISESSLEHAQRLVVTSQLKAVPVLINFYQNQGRGRCRPEQGLEFSKSKATPMLFKSYIKKKTFFVNHYIENPYILWNFITISQQDKMKTNFYRKFCEKLQCRFLFFLFPLIFLFPFISPLWSHNTP